MLEVCTHYTHSRHANIPRPLFQRERPVLTKWGLMFGLQIYDELVILDIREERK